MEHASHFLSGHHMATKIYIWSPYQNFWSPSRNTRYTWHKYVMKQCINTRCFLFNIRRALFSLTECTTVYTNVNINFKDFFIFFFFLREREREREGEERGWYQRIYHDCLFYACQVKLREPNQNCREVLLKRKNMSLKRTY